MSKAIPLLIFVSMISSTALLGGCGTNSSPSTNTPPHITSSSNKTSTTQQPQTIVGTGSSPEKPVVPEKNPTGDIPDTQAFVTYTSSADGYELVVPEGWGRTTKDHDVLFQDKLNGVQVALTQQSSQPTVASVGNDQVAELKKTGRAITLNSVKQVNLPSGSAILISYDSNSDPDPVTGKQVRLENSRYLFYKNGELAALTLWAPLGADNVDQWNRMSASFKWR
ncbi:PsbP-related protein [Desulfosporosinus sp. PR]|uniref:PsbP-related protein n=1 Tax=Candidatus Desulfosporosinus nitrosoreducens TaxID=3401928 RepID=UPI0027EF3B74|nr:PsbP-related protein [Desulfosporosinus sp. PR]MDQ7097084.1 PsbP-related protein [Desulfosporosinus sp. PR]